MALLPRVRADLALAPVAAAVDRNLSRLRDLEPAEIEDELTLILGIAIRRSDRAQRERWLLEAATLHVDLRGWAVALSDDGCRLQLTGGSVSLELGLGASLARYLEVGTAATLAA